MNPNWTDAETWIDIVDHIWIGFVLLAAAAVPSVMAARNHKGISEVKAQVLNAHKTNLRDDVDRVIAVVEQLSHDMRGLRTDLATEEDRRRQQIDELRKDVDRIRRR